MHVPADPNVIAPVFTFSTHWAVPAPPTNAYVTEPVPDPPEAANVSALPKLTVEAFVNVNVV